MATREQVGQARYAEQEALKRSGLNSTEHREALADYVRLSAALRAERAAKPSQATSPRTRDYSARGRYSPNFTINDYDEGGTGRDWR